MKKYTLPLSCRSSKILRDHRIGGLNLFPAAGCLQAVLEFLAPRPNSPGSLREISLAEPIIVDPREEIELAVTFETTGGRLRFRVESAGGREHVSGFVEKAGTPPSPLNLPEIRSRCPERFTREEYYKGMNKDGLAYGLHLQTITGLKYNAGEVLAELAFLPQVKLKKKWAPFHPAILDGAIQSVAILSRGQPLSVPFYLADFTVYRPLEPPLVCYGLLRDDNNPETPLLKYDLQLAAPGGEVAARVTKLLLKHVGSKHTAKTEPAR